MRSFGDWGFVTDRIATLAPMHSIGKPSYHAYTHGWILREIVRRTDPLNRPYHQFIQEQRCRPLGITDLWVGLADHVGLSQIEKLVDDTSVAPRSPDPPLSKASPAHLRLTPEISETPIMRRACLAATGGICTARTEARFWAVLANGGDVDGVRLLSRERVEAATVRRAADFPDSVMFNAVMSVTQGVIYF